MSDACEKSFEVVFVCTANRARSVLAEALYRRYTVGLDTRVRSFGTQEVGSAPALDDAVRAGRALGVDLSGHTAAALPSGSLAGVDLVLGFEKHHVAAGVVDGAAAPGRTFLLGELVALLEPASQPDGTVEHARAEVRAANERRANSRIDTGQFVTPDPAGRPSRVMLATATEIDELVHLIVRGLFGGHSRA